MNKSTVSIIQKVLASQDIIPLQALDALGDGFAMPFDQAIIEDICRHLPNLPENYLDDWTKEIGFGGSSHSGIYTKNDLLIKCLQMDEEHVVYDVMISLMVYKLYALPPMDNQHKVFTKVHNIFKKDDMCYVVMDRAKYDLAHYVNNLLFDQIVERLYGTIHAFETLRSVIAIKKNTISKEYFTMFLSIFGCEKHSVKYLNTIKRLVKQMIPATRGVAVILNLLQVDHAIKLAISLPVDPSFELPKYDGYYDAAFTAFEHKIELIDRLYKSVDYNSVDSVDLIDPINQSIQVFDQAISNIQTTIFELQHSLVLRFGVIQCDDGYYNWMIREPMQMTQSSNDGNQITVGDYGGIGRGSHDTDQDIIDYLHQSRIFNNTVNDFTSWLSFDDAMIKMLEAGGKTFSYHIINALKLPMDHDLFRGKTVTSGKTSIVNPCGEIE